MTDTQKLAQIADRLEIQDNMARYARGVDRRDWDRVRAVFHPDAHDDHGEYKGGVDGFIEWVTKRHANIAQSMHFLGNCLIEFADDDTALVETYYIAMQRLDEDAGSALTLLVEGGGSAPSGAVDVDILGRYIDQFERRDGAWKVARRVVAFDSIRTHPVSSGPLNPDWALARRDDKDPVFQMRAALGLA
ncbi:MAG: nuclear transport factor 2 family protein [Proteobacteria bacterium]|nr:nuclear transport factor 2 family protein [Pseudomonadota bacterium]